MFKLVLPSLTVLAALFAGPAAALQSPDPIEYCRETSGGKNEQIACLEAAITALMAQRSASAPPPPPDAADAAVAPSSVPAPAESMAAADPAPAEAAEAPPLSGLGAEQVERRLRKEDRLAAAEEEAVEVSAAVVEFGETALGKALLILDNGQVWRQRDSDRNRIRLSSKQQYTVTIKQGMISGYRIHINELNRTFVAERIQ